MDKLAELQPEDLIIQVYNTTSQGGMHTAYRDTGVRVFHKPSGMDISVERHRSQHKNRNEAITIIKDILTPFEEGGIVYTENGEGLLVSCANMSGTVEDDNGKFAVYLDRIGHTLEGYKYLAIKLKLEMIADYEKDIRCLQDEIKALQAV